MLPPHTPRPNQIQRAISFLSGDEVIQESMSWIYLHFGQAAGPKLRTGDYPPNRQVFPAFPMVHCLHSIGLLKVLEPAYLTRLAANSKKNVAIIIVASSRSSHEEGLWEFIGRGHCFHLLPTSIFQLAFLTP